jgi:(p)ppGpp synthase/HD superfamily hydrolase
LVGSHPSSPCKASAEETRSPPAWIAESPLLARAYSVAESAHRGQRRPTDRRPFLDHVTEVATFLHEAAFDDELVAVGLLHDSVERGTLREEELRREMGETITSLVLVLTEDARIESFEARKAALRDQVRSAGGLAVTVFAADKLSDIVGLRRGIEESREAIEERMGTTIAGMAGHYRESVELIESVRPGSAFLPALRVQIDRLGATAVSGDAPSLDQLGAT